MKRCVVIALFFAVFPAVALRLPAQPAPPPSAPNTHAPNQPAQDAQKPPDPQSQSGSNAFPGDTSNVPVMPSSGVAALPEGTYTGGDDSPSAALPGDDLDPARSPDDPVPAANSAQDQQWSSSLSGLDKMLPPPDEGPTGKKGKPAAKEPTHQEAASNDIDVGNYYVQTKNWRAALSRFQSAMVLAPDNPDVFWGLAETERHLGDFADARAYYQKVVDYDPDSRHGKDARKALKDPEIANAQNAAHGQPVVAPTQ